jgi:spore maturation protein CgeB
MEHTAETMGQDRREFGTPEQASATLTLVKTKKGCLSLKVGAEQGAQKTLHSLYDPEQEARRAVEGFDFDGEGLLVVLGLGLGYHVAELTRRFPDTELLVVEASSEIFRLMEEHTGLPAETHVIRYLVGLTPKEVTREITRNQIRKGLAPVSVYTLAPAVSCFPDYYGPILDTLQKTASVRLWDKLKYRKFVNPTARVALIDFGYFLSREIQNALHRLGHEITIVPVTKGEEGSAIVSRIIDKTISFAPDFFLTINHLGFDEEGVVTSFFQSIEMPVASWYVDSPNLIVKAFGQNVSPYTTLFLWDKGYLRDMESMGFESVVHLPLATDERIFRPLRRNGRKAGIKPCDVGFVGSSMVEPVNDRMAKVEPDLHHLVEKTAQAILASRDRIEDSISELPEPDQSRLARLDPAQKTDFEAAVLWKTTLLYRWACVESLRPFEPRIHGDPGWKDLLGEDQALFPSLDYYKALPIFYNRCKINFNATSLQMRQAVNQRVFDVPACGSFLLTDRQVALEELFEVGKEIIAFDDPEEIPDLVRFYLDSPEARNRIACRGRERVLERHTYRHRLQVILQTMRARYG